MAGSLDAGSSCVYGISFTPTFRAPVSWFLFLVDNNLNAVLEGTGQDITLSGTGTSSDATRTTIRVSPNPVKAGLGVTMIVTVSDTFSPATIAQGGVTFTDSVGGQVVALDGGAAVPLSNGRAVVTMVPSVAGAHTISAHYGGVDDSFLAARGKRASPCCRSLLGGPGRLDGNAATGYLFHATQCTAKQLLLSDGGRRVITSSGNFGMIAPVCAYIGRTSSGASAITASLDAG